jgi:hypothetical protein
MELPERSTRSTFPFDRFESVADAMKSSPAGQVEAIADP